MKLNNISDSSLLFVSVYQFLTVRFACYFSGKGEYMSIFFCLMNGRWDSLLPWPFSCKVCFTVLDQSDKQQVYDMSARFTPNPIRENLPFLGRPTNYRNPSLGE